MKGHDFFHNGKYTTITFFFKSSLPELLYQWFCLSLLLASNGARVYHVYMRLLSILQTLDSVLLITEKASIITGYMKIKCA